MKRWDDLTPAEKVDALVDDLVADFLHYDRKECEEFSVGEIDHMISIGETSVDRLVGVFRKSLEKGLEK